MQPEDYRAAVERYRDMVWRVALNGTRHTQDAEDVTQEVFLRLFTTRKPFQGEAHLKHWRRRATVNRCRSLMASPWHARRAALEPDEAAPDPAAQLQGEKRDLYDALRTLPAQARLALYLYYFEGLSTREMAGLLHCTQTAVTTRLQRARQALRRAMTEEPEIDPRLPEREREDGAP